VPGALRSPVAFSRRRPRWRADRSVRPAPGERVYVGGRRECSAIQRNAQPFELDRVAKRISGVRTTPVYTSSPLTRRSKSVRPAATTRPPRTANQVRRGAADVDQQGIAELSAVVAGREPVGRGASAGFRSA